MKCPMCGNELRQSEDDPKWGLCDSCMVKFEWKDGSDDYADLAANYATTANDYGIEDENNYYASEPDYIVAENYSPDPKLSKKGNAGLTAIKACLIILSITAATLLAFFAGLAGGVNNAVAVITDNTDSAVSKNNNDADQKAKTGSVQTQYKVGDTATQDNVQITLISATESLGDDYVKPDTGTVYLILEFNISNQSSDSITISSIMDFEAYCDDYAISQDLGGLLMPEADGKKQLDGSVAPGKKINGIITYQVPDDYKTFEINFTLDFWTGQQIKFMVTK